MEEREREAAAVVGVAAGSFWLSRLLDAEREEYAHGQHASVHQSHELNGGASSLPSSAAVVIIGAGMTGMATTYWLRRYGVADVVVLEQRDGLAHGATGRNGGHCWPSFVPFSETQVKLYGKDDQNRLFQFKRRNFELVKEFIQNHNVACDFCNHGSLTLARYESEVTFLKEYLEHLKEINPDIEVEWWDKAKCEQEVHSPAFLGGLHQPVAASFYPAKVVYAIAREVRKMGGVRIFIDTPVLEVAEQENILPKSYTIRTSNGDITTPCVVFATNAWSSTLIPSLKDVIAPVRGQALVTSPIPQLRWLRNLAFDDGYQYMIQREDGRVVLGGMRWVTPTKERNTLDDSSYVQYISEKLHEFLEDSFPGLQEDKGQGVAEGKIAFRVEHEWTGLMAYSRDGLPLIGPLTELSPPTEGGVRGGQFIGAGYTGNGMAYCFAAGQALAEMVSGRLEPQDFVQCLLPSRYFDPAKRAEIDREAEEKGEWYWALARQ